MSTVVIPGAPITNWTWKNSGPAVTEGVMLTPWKRLTDHPGRGPPGPSSASKTVTG